MAQRKSKSKNQFYQLSEDKQYFPLTSCRTKSIMIHVWLAYRIKNTMFSFHNFRQWKNSLGLKLVSIQNNVVLLYADMHFKYESQVRKLHLQSELF